MVLYKHGPAWGLSCMSPAATAVEAYLRLAGIPFAAQCCSSAAASPSGVLPTVECSDRLFGPREDGSSDDGGEWAVVWEVFEHLKKARVDLDGSLPAEKKALVAAFQALAEKCLFPATSYFLWVDFASWRKHTVPAYGSGMPFPISHIVPYMHRRTELARYKGPQSKQSLEDGAASCYQALNQHLRTTGGPFLLGSKPSSLDAVVFSHLIFHRNAPGCVELQRLLCKHEALCDYVQRLHGDVFSAPAPAPPVDHFSGGQETKKAKEHAQDKHRTAKELRFKRRGQVWLGCAAAALIGYVLLSGNYISVDADFWDEDEED